MSVFGYVILHYGDPQITRNCITSILNTDGSEECHIIVVDNDHKECVSGESRLVETYADHKNIKIICTDHDMGFSEANNIGFKAAKDIGDCDFIVVANNDIEIRGKDFHGLIEDSYKVYQWDVLSPDVVSSITGNHQSPIDTKARNNKELLHTIVANRLCLTLYPLVKPILKKSLASGDSREYIRHVMKEIVPCGACIVLSRCFIHSEEKLFCPETMFYYEEYIFHEKCRRRGYSIVYDPKIKVLHHDGSATQNRTGSEDARIRFRLENIAKSAGIYWRYMNNKEK